LQTHEEAKITGNISSSNVTLGGFSKGNINADQIRIRSGADVEGVLNQKNLSVEDGAKLKIKTETY
jgi:cytoskeletal protein CcmA (bactofilin family)